MKRLTTDDEKSIVFSLNTFYAKDGEVWIRDGGPYPDYPDCTLVQWIKSAAEKHNLCIEGEDPEQLGDEMYDALQDGDETIEGILALMHAAAVQAAEMRGRLQLIEDVLGAEYDLEDLRAMMEENRWVSVDDHLPPEHDSIFKKLLKTDKWVDGMYRSESCDVIVSVKFGDGTRKTGATRTNDGHWVGLPSIGHPIVTHWRPFPKPYE